MEALAYVQKREKAIDIGGGALRNTRLLLNEGFEALETSADRCHAEAVREERAVLLFDDQPLDLCGFGKQTLVGVHRPHDVLPHIPRTCGIRRAHGAHPVAVRLELTALRIASRVV